MAIDYGLNYVPVLNPSYRYPFSMVVEYTAFGFFVPGYDISDGDVNGFFGCGNFNLCFHVFLLVGPLGLEPRTDGL